MASNSFGNQFRITTWGESHGKAIGVVIDGCPAGLPITEEEITTTLAARAPGRSSLTSPRKEPDQAQLLSGVFEGQTTGTPLSILIWNRDADSSKYEPIRDLLRPGHANYTYLKKYGLFDHRGGGRASARETACRVAAGAIAKKLLAHYQIDLVAYIKEVGGITATIDSGDIAQLRAALNASPVRCPDPQASEQISLAIEQAKCENDSLGGIVEVITGSLPVGLGEPIYEKIEAQLAKAFLSIPACKGFEIGSGFDGSRMSGSHHNDPFSYSEGRFITQSNHAGGCLGGLTTGMALQARAAFKPTSSIGQSQQTVDTAGNPHLFDLPQGSRHDPCVALRAVPVIEAMTALVLADFLLMNRCAALEI